jgi:uncharacterized protein YqjF (DUF2071 family)
MCCECFHGFSSSNQAEKALLGAKPGTYLLRFRYCSLHHCVVHTFLSILTKHHTSWISNSASTFGAYAISYVRQQTAGTEIVHRVIRRENDKYALVLALVALVVIVLMRSTLPLTHWCMDTFNRRYVIGNRKMASLMQVVTDDHQYWGLTDPCKEVFRPQHLFRRHANPNLVGGYLADAPPS